MKRILVEIKKQGGGYSLFADGVCKLYGCGAAQIHTAFALYSLGAEDGGARCELSEESYSVLNKAREE